MDEIILGLDDWLKVLMEAEVVGEESGHASSTTQISFLPDLTKLIQDLTPKITINESRFRKAIIIFRETIGPNLRKVKGMDQQGKEKKVGTFLFLASS